MLLEARHEAKKGNSNLSMGKSTGLIAKLRNANGREQVELHHMNRVFRVLTGKAASVVLSKLNDLPAERIFVFVIGALGPTEFILRAFLIALTMPTPLGAANKRPVGTSPNY